MSLVLDGLCVGAVFTRPLLRLSGSMPRIAVCAHWSSHDMVNVTLRTLHLIGAFRFRDGFNDCKNSVACFFVRNHGSPPSICLYVGIVSPVRVHVQKIDHAVYVLLSVIPKPQDVAFPLRPRRDDLRRPLQMLNERLANNRLNRSGNRFAVQAVNLRVCLFAVQSFSPFAARLIGPLAHLKSHTLQQLRCAGKCCF